ELSRWRQFNDVNIELHDRLTILTGANGAGKSTVLKILKCHFPYESDEKFLATPVQEEGATRFSPGSWFSNVFGQIFSSPKPQETDQRRVGQIGYSDGSICSLSLPLQDSMQYALSRSVKQQINGVSVNSHRPAPKYDQLKNIPI